MSEITTVEQWLGDNNKIGIDIWHKKYQNNNEAFNEWLERVSNGNADLKRIILDKKFLFGGRILSNRGLHKHGTKITYSNCYVIEPPEDNIESIFDCARSLARTFSFGGGVGVDISKLAPRGAKINNAAKTTSGAVSFMDLYSLSTELIGQNGRRGALMISIDCNHPDLEEFIDIKSDLNKVTKANISIRMTDEFLSAVKKKEKYVLSYLREETGEEIKKEVNAYKLFKKLAKMNWDYAEPGILFWDRIENWNLLSEDGNFKFSGVNPCVSGDTLILTSSGYVPIEEVADKEVNVWNGYEFSPVVPKITGRNQKMKLITFSDGTELKCTYYHKFVLKNGERVDAINLEVGDKLAKHHFPIINDGVEVDGKIAYTQGFFMGDGSRETNRDRLSIKLYGEKRKVVDRLIYNSIVYCKSFDGEFLTLPFTPAIYNKDFVPCVEYSIQTRLNWLAGYIDSDGTLQSSDGGLSISSTNKEVLRKVKYMLNTIGCTGTISVTHAENTKLMPKNNVQNESGLYKCVTSYRLTISATNVKKLIDLGLKLSRVDLVANPNRDASRFISVTSISEADLCDVVYCFVEEKNHSGIFNGVLTAQCGEEPLPAGGSCLLGSINLAAFVVDNEFQFDKLEDTVKIAVQALNDVLDEGIELHPLVEQRESVRTWRQIGLGIMGLADCLIKMGYKYGDVVSVDFSRRIASAISNTAIFQSAMLAKERGAFENCDEEIINKSEYFKHNATELTQKVVGTYGLRNSQILTCAPTGTLSTMLGISGGIEPIFANYYTRKTQSLHDKEVDYKVYTPIVEEYMKAHNIQDDKDLPDFFVTSQELDYKSRVEMQAVWQEHIDASISSTVNLPNSATVDDVAKLYMYAWEKGLKGITIYRNGCKREGILSVDAGNETTTETKFDSIEPISKDELGETYGVNVKRRVACGNLYLNICRDKEGNLAEIFVNTGKGGICQSNINAVSRLASTALRSGVKIEEIVDQLRGIVCPACTKHLKDSSLDGLSCADIIARTLCEEYNKDEIIIKKSKKRASSKKKVAKPTAQVQHDDLTKCVECSGEIKFESGCVTCLNCGWTKCS